MKTILVAYATRAGSTFEIATCVAQVLGAAGATVNVKPVTAVYEVSGYDAVIIGSAIRMGCWLPEAAAFVQTHHEALSHIPTAYFLVSGLLGEETPDTRRKVRAFLDPVCAILEPVSIGLFAGKVDFNTMNWHDRTIAEAVSSSEGDWRNWAAIRGWAQELELILVRA